MAAPIVIAVMGVTGVGKSYFVEKATGQGPVVGNGLESCTSEVTSFTTVLGSLPVTLVDTPGFDDTHKNDAEILFGIAEFLKNVYVNRGKLSGILYLHDITEARMKGSAMKNLQMFQKLIGNRCLKNVVLVTTKWSAVSMETGEARERELYNNFWKPMVACQAQMRRFDGTSQCALDILGDLTWLQGIVPQLTDEICLKGLQLKQTAAGKVVNVDMEEKLQDKEAEVQIAKREIEEAKARHDTEMEDAIREHKSTLQDEIKRMKEGQALLELRMKEEKQRYEAQIAERDRARHVESMRRQIDSGSKKRGLGRFIAGSLGAVAIIATGGLAAPLVAAGAVITEKKMQEDREKDHARMNAAFA